MNETIRNRRVSVSDKRRAEKIAQSAVKHLVSLFKKSKFRVFAVSGSLDLYLDDRVMKAVGEARSRHVRVEIIAGPQSPTDLVKKLTDLGCVVTILLNYPPIHFAVGDGSRIRYEGIHLQGVEVSVNSVRRFAPQSAAKLENLGKRLVSE